MIRVEKLTKEFVRKGGDGRIVRKLAVDDLSLEIKKGEIFGLLGPNGAGKTTTIRMLTMQTEKTAGKIWYDGMALEENAREIKALIGVVPQHINFDNDLTVVLILNGSVLLFIHQRDAFNIMCDPQHDHRSSEDAHRPSRQSLDKQ